MNARTPKAPAAAPSPTAQIVFAAALVAAAAGAVSLGGLASPLQGIDTRYVLDNEALLQWDRAATAEGFPGAGPLAKLLLAFGVWAAPGGAAGLHMIGLALHVLTSIAVYLTARRLFGPMDRETAPMAAGLLFAVHPLALLTYTSPALAALALAAAGVLGAVAAFLAATSDGVRLRFGCYAAALCCAAVAWASHSAAWIAPFVILAADGAARSGGMYWSRLRLHAPFFLLAASGWAVASGERAGLPDILAAAGMARRALGRALWPWGGLVHDAGPTAPMWLITLAVCIAAVMYLVWRRRAIGAILALVLLGLVAAYLPVAKAGAAYVPGAAYLGLTGVAMLLPWAMRAASFAPTVPKALGAVAAGLILAGGWVSFQQVLMRQTPERLWEAVAARHPDDSYALYQVGRLRVARGEAMLQDASTLARAGRTDAAQALLDDGASVFASAIEPLTAAAERGGEPVYWFYLGAALFYENRDEEAIRAFEKALESDLAYQDAALRLALLHHARFDATGDRAALVQAVEHYRLADSIGPFPLDTAQRFTAALASMGAYEEAAAFLERLTDRPGVDPAPLTAASEQVATLVARAAELDQAAVERTLAAPESAEGFLAAGHAFSFRNRHQQAAYAYEAALGAAPGDTRAWVGLGRAYAGMGAEAAFIAHFSQPSGADAAGAWEALAQACIEARHYGSAADYLQAAGAERPAVRAADMAWDLAPPEEVKALLQRAAEEAPGDPVPWLRLFDLAIAKGRASEAVDSLAEAERLGAAAADIASRREQLEGRLADPDAASLRVTPADEATR